MCCKYKYHFLLLLELPRVKSFIKILFIVIFPLENISWAQDAFIGGGTTLSTYFGDLAPFNLKQSFAAIKPGIGLYGSRKIFDPVFLEIEFEHSTLSGDDKNQSIDSRKVRNLSFKSPITGLSTQLGLRIPVLKGHKAGISTSAGMALFRFDPQAYIDGRWVRLQPLSTEGQGLPGSSSKPYSLFQTAKIFQVGAFYRISRSLFIEIEASQYFTSTDYLDDVSGTYFDPEKLRQVKGDLALRLADRHAEIDPGSPNYPGGTPRGNPKKNDQFAYVKIGIGWALYDKKYGSNNYAKVKCPMISKDWFIK
jgi:hypothetical protein